MWAGCYSLDLYCENQDMRENHSWPDAFGHAYRAFPVQLTGRTFTDTSRRARRLGWLIKKDGTAVCPLCAPKWAGGGK